MIIVANIMVTRNNCHHQDQILLKVLTNYHKFNLYNDHPTFISSVKERFHSEMKISLIKQVILVIVPIRFISFRLFFWTERLRQNNAGPGSENTGPDAIMQALEVIFCCPNGCRKEKECFQSKRKQTAQYWGLISFCP